jgi:hypothetical protein
MGDSQAEVSIFACALRQGKLQLDTLGQMQFAVDVLVFGRV